MAKPGRPASENYQPVCCSVSQSVSYSSTAGSEGLEDEDDKAPIFSLSKSSMDVVMATGPPHKRDPAWTRMDLKRSSSTNTHSEQSSVMLQQLHPHVWQQVNNLQAPLAAQHVDALGPPAISERWLANMQRWSECSGSTHSRSSTPDTVVWKGGSSRPCSLTQEGPCSSAPDSPMSKTASSPTTPSPFVSPLQTPTLPPLNLSTSSFPLTLSTHQQGDSPHTTSPLPSPLQAHTYSPLPSPLQAHTYSPLPSPLQAHTSSPLLSPLQAHTTSPLPSPLQPHTTSPLPSPLQAHTTSPLPSPLQAHTYSPLPSPLQAHTSSPLPSPLQAHTYSPLPSPLQAHTSSPLPSPLQPHTTSPLPSPLQAHTSSPLPSPLQAHTTSPLPSPLQAHTTSPLPSPLQAHTTSPLPSPLQAHTTSPLPSPLQAHTTSPLPSPLQAHTTSPLPSNSSNPIQLTDTDDECFLENNSLSFQYPSPITSSVSLKEGCESSDPGCLADGVIEEPPSCEGMPLSEVEGVRSPVRMSSDLTPNSAADGQESGRGASVSHLQLPWQLGQRCWRSPLVSSLSDSGLRECCRCHFTSREGITQAPKVEMFREEGTMTSQLELVDAAVQTLSPVNSWWDLRRNMSTSNMGSHSILGSPPGSRLNLKSSVGSHSNLVSPSSSMFPVSSGEDEEEERQGDDPTWDVNTASSHGLERRRSCLKIQGDERDELGRRSSMKQVQWDEDGMTWDVHGACLDPEELSTAIRKHLELKNSPRPTRRTSKKKKAPKPPLISNMVKAMAPEMNPPVMVITSTCLVEGETEETPEADGGREVEEEGGGGKKEETVEAARRISKAEGENVKEKEEEVYVEEGTSHPKSPSSGHSRKRSVIRSLRRPGWCGGSRKVDD